MCPPKKKKVTTCHIPGFCSALDVRFDAFMDYSIPEILRVPLEELCLHIMVYKPNTLVQTNKKHTKTNTFTFYHMWKHSWSFCLTCFILSSLISSTPLSLSLSLSLSRLLEMSVRLPRGLLEPGPGSSSAPVGQQRRQPAEEDRCMSPQRSCSHPSRTSPR